MTIQDPFTRRYYFAINLMAYGDRETPHKEYSMFESVNLERVSQYARYIAASIIAYIDEAESRVQAVKHEVIHYKVVVNFDKNGSLAFFCPHCGANTKITQKSSIIRCEFCGKEYVIPNKLLDIL